MSRRGIPAGVFALHGLALVAFGGLAIAASSPAIEEGPGRFDELRAWKLEPGPAEAATAHHRLIGFACGPDRLTMTAEHEDHFPTCEAIEVIEDVCPPYEDGLVTAAECARYMGDGW